MNHSQQIFIDQINKIEALLIKSQKQKNPSMWLYKNDARTTLFMLEGLSRMYAGLHNKKRFTKIKDWCKILEDSLGGIDYQVAMHNYCKTNKSIPANITQHFADEIANACDAMNAYLADSFGAKQAKFEKMKQKINSADWLAEEKESKAIVDYYKTQIKKINEWYIAEAREMNDIELHVHELRRKLRWLSIIPQALQGKIQLAGDVKIIIVLKKYITKEITSSPFNKLAPIGKLKSVAYLNKQHFYALSWMIAELGKLKDSGLVENGVALAYASIHLCDAEQASKTTKGMHKNYVSINDLLKQANAIVKEFFDAKILNALVKM
jgi:hypothetical protein